MPFTCRLNPSAIAEINDHCKHSLKSAPLGAGTAIGWFVTAGQLISTYLPDFLEVLKALSSVTGTAPTVGMFFRKGAEMFQDHPEPDITSPPDPADK